MTEHPTEAWSINDVAQSLDVVTASLDALRDEAVAQEPLETVLNRLAHTAVAALPDVDAVSVTQLVKGAPTTVALTDDALASIDERQYATGRGPCLEAARTLKPVRAVIGEHRSEWPEFTEAAEEAGVRAYLSVPILVEVSDAPDELIGSFSGYSYHAEAFDPFDERLVRLLTTAASAAITNAQRWQRAREQVVQLRSALTSRAEIDQAKGVLMAMHGITGEEAFRRLAEMSQRTNTKLHEVARDFMTRCTSRPA